jgi:transcriptional regulator with XRE-family HTH domain
MELKNNRLINSRIKKVFTQEELAGMLGYTKAAVSNWENGVSVPRMKDAFILSKILEKEVDYLFLTKETQNLIL